MTRAIQSPAVADVLRIVAGLIKQHTGDRGIYMKGDAVNWAGVVMGLEAESTRLSAQTAAPAKGGYYRCTGCGFTETVEREVKCWKCGKGLMAWIMPPLPMSAVDRIGLACRHGEEPARCGICKADPERTPAPVGPSVVGKAWRCEAVPGAIAPPNAGPGCRFPMCECRSTPNPAPGPNTSVRAAGETFQEQIGKWMLACFGPEISADKIERNHRFLEEALELVQANGCVASEAHQLVDYVYGRPVGNLHQEVGGVMVTLAALCLASGLDMDKAAEDEKARIWTKVDAIRAKQAAKPKHSPLPESPAPTGAGAVSKEWESVYRNFGVVRVEKWPEGLVLWVGGEIVWKSWAPLNTRSPLRSETPGDGLESAAETWAWIEHILVEECGFLTDQGLASQRGNFVSAIARGRVGESLLKAAAEFLSVPSLARVRVDGHMMDRDEVADALTRLSTGKETK